MLRKLALATAISAVTMGANFAHAVGLGEITLNSHLNEPLDAEIKLLSVGDLSKNELLPNLAGHEEFERAGVERVFFLTGIKFDVQKNADGSAVIKLKSSRIVREPFLNFLVEIHWPSGRLLREYTVFLDPPIFSERAAPVITQAPATTPAPSRAPQPTDKSAVTDSGRTTGSARAPAGNTANLNQDGGDTIRVKKNDTLWNIAAKVRPGRDVTVRQTMLALQRQNQHAFINNNINLLKAGAVLRTPSLQDVQTISNAEARGEVARQAREWRNKQETLDATQDDVLAYQTNDSEPEAEASGQLKLVTDDFTIVDDAQASGSSLEGSDNLGSGSAADGSGSGDASLVTAELQDEVSELKRIIMLQNQKLELLQKSIKEGQADDAQLEEVSAALSEAETNAEAPVPEAEPEPQAQPTLAEEPEQSLVDRLTSSPLYIGLAVLIGLVVLGVIGLVTRRKQDDNYPDDLRQVLDHDQVELPDELDTVASATDNAGQTAAVADSDIDKVIEEADVYINYGRHERAVELLQPAVDANPDSTELRLKLAEVYAATGDEAGVTQQEAGLEAIGDEDALVALAAIKAKHAVGAEPTFANVEPIEEDTLSELQPVAAEEPVEDAVDELVELDDTATSDSDDNVLEFELPDSQDAAAELEPQPELPTEPQTEPQPEEAVAEQATSEDADDMAFLEDADESATKLELARAYIDMADADAAQEILQEVIAEGSDTQKAEAEQLLQNLG